VRFQGVELTERGVSSGVFALVNGLAFAGSLTAAQERFRRVNNDWFNDHLPDPCRQDPTLYDRQRHPQATSWFRETAEQMLQRVDGYLRILDAHGIAWRATWSSDPGIVLYDDEHQVVVVPARPASSASRQSASPVSTAAS
jgi:hypothetical protein